MSSDENTVNLATAELFHAEIARLHGVNDRLRAEIERLRTMAFNPATLTDAERLAIQFMLRHAAQAASNDLFPDSADYIPHHKVIFAMMERLE